MGTAAISLGPKLGLLNNAAIGEQYYDQFRPFLRGMDALIMGSVLSVSTIDPPVSPSNGDSYLLLEGGTGVWDGHTNQIAVYSTQITDTGNNTLAPGWDFYTPQSGWIVYSTEAEFTGFLYWNGTAWGFLVGNGFVLQNPTENQFIGQPIGTTFSISIASGQEVLLSGDGTTASPANMIIGGGGQSSDPNNAGNNAGTTEFFSSNVMSFPYTWISDLNFSGNSINLSGSVGGRYIFVNKSSSFTINLPPTSNGSPLLSDSVMVYTIKNSGGNALTITLNPSSGETIDGSSSYVMTTAYASVTIVATLSHHNPVGLAGWAVTAKV